MREEHYILNKNEWETFLSNYDNILTEAIQQQEFRNIISLLKDERIYSRKYYFGRFFLEHFPEARDYLICNSNLGTPPGVFHPNDDIILEDIEDKKKAIDFILDRIEIKE